LKWRHDRWPCLPALP